MRVSIFVPLFTAISVGVGSASSAFADVLAYDTASNYNNTTNPWINGANSGSGTPGFTTPWSIQTAGSGSTSIAGPIGGLGSSAWAIDAPDDYVSSGGNPSGVNAVRSFPTLSPNDYVGLDLNADNVAADGAVGIQIGYTDSFHFPAFSDLITFQLLVAPSYVGYLTSPPVSDQDYLIVDSDGVFDTGITADDLATHMNFRLTTDGTFTATLTQAGSTPYIIDGTMDSPAINTIGFVDQSGGSTFYLNNLNVVPLPPAAVGACPLLALLGLRKLRRRQQA